MAANDFQCLKSNPYVCLFCRLFLLEAFLIHSSDRLFIVILQISCFKIGILLCYIARLLFSQLEQFPKLAKQLFYFLHLHSFYFLHDGSRLRRQSQRLLQDSYQALNLSPRLDTTTHLLNHFLSLSEVLLRQILALFNQPLYLQIDLLFEPLLRPRQDLQVHNLIQLNQQFIKTIQYQSGSLAQIIELQQFCREMALISRECSMYLTVDNSMDFLHYQTLSGLGFNKLGLYEECIEDPNNQFYLLQGDSDIFNAIDQSPGHYFMSGLCFNKICSASDLEYALTSLQQYIPKTTINYLNIQTPSLIQQNYDVQTIAFLVILSILLLLFLGCSIVDLLMRKKKHCMKFIEIFSVLTIIRLLDPRSERNNERVKVFSGVKAMSLVAIALTNIGTNAFFAPTTSFYSQTQDQSIYTLFYGVDVWLMTSGFFLSYLLLKQYHRHHNYKILLLKIVRRFFRLWPIYLTCLLLNWKIMPFIGSGPLWPLLIDYPKKQCLTTIPHRFMISNLVNEKCYNSMWLLELDFQLCFIFVPLLVLYTRSSTDKVSKYAFIIIQLVFLASSLSAGFWVDEKNANSLTKYFFLTEYYGENIKPYVRCGGFLIGYNLGIAFFNFKKGHCKETFWIIKILKKKIYRIMLPLIGFIGLNVVAFSFALSNNNNLTLSNFFYFTSLRTIVPLLVALIILPSLFGYLSAIKSLSQSWVCNLISKLSLSIYGIHYCVATYMIYCRQSDLQLSNFTVIFLAFCTLIPSVVLSIVLTSIIEIPVFVCKKIYSKTARITYFEH